MLDLVDIGANLTDRAFADDLDAILDRADAAGVRRIVLTGTSVKGSAEAADLASSRPGMLFSTAGVHPHDAKSCNDNTIPELKTIAKRAPVVALGECGLDYNRDFSPRDVQRQWFDAQLQAAADLGMPVFIHERDAAEDLSSIIENHRGNLSRAVVHCFTGEAEALKRYLDLDLYIGITGWICDERRGQHLHELVKLVPSNRLMLETDSPYLLPRSIRPKPKKRRNEPAFLPYVLETVAQCLGRSPADVAAATTATAVEFFGLPG
jgi:TatD DNase family protein